MPTVNVSDDGKERIERIQEASDWSPSNREVVDRALKVLEEQQIEDADNN